ncbi:hypothetical protein FisN_3Hu145 [Fistulifera solaris]|uniref:Uncharacterized protein n=1 Tax=Fistulifera solaris TaxID=1519565 RepID=A0A1Z5JPA8_FISSO|nr:hypothetical protein FisN_3Hu145 [Fistulifera solaris]|eukprot:GAX15672.1 hypothetical protein FisN_3Hu145 [Fistulifera solaris]
MTISFQQLDLGLKSPVGGVLVRFSAIETIMDDNILEENYAEDILCRSCRHAFATESMRCGASIPESSFHSDTHIAKRIRQSGIEVSRQYPQTCAQCHPDHCPPADKRYWRYDRVDIATQKAVHVELNAVPFRNRLPPHAVENITQYLLMDYPERIYPAREYFFDYNPSIIQLPEPDGKARYLASFRVSNQHYCLHPDERKLMNGIMKTDGSLDSAKSPPPAKNWLGLAWLDEQLQIVQDTILDVRPVGFPAAEDFRLVRLGNEIYLTSYDQIAPLFFHEKNDTVRIPQVHPEIPAPTVYLRNFVSCAPCRRTSKRGFCGKNFNYVGLTPDQAIAEIWPSPPHLVRTVNLTQPCDRSAEPEDFVDVAASLRPSFATVEEVLFPHLPSEASLLTRGRGGACCIPWVDPRTQQPVWVGVLHTKTPSQGNRQRVANVTANHYLSQFYAFEQAPPFNLVALSGFFCLGFQDGADRVHHLAQLSSWRRLELGITFNCPRIHFVSGITFKAGDPSTIVLALGVNDCYSLFLEVPTSSVDEMLFQCPPG